jgi:Phasin protein
MKPFRTICTHIGEAALTPVNTGRIPPRPARTVRAMGAAVVQLCVTAERRWSARRGFRMSARAFSRSRVIAEGPSRRPELTAVNARPRARCETETFSGGREMTRERADITGAAEAVPAMQVSQAYLARIAEFEQSWFKPMGNFGAAAVEAWAEVGSEWLSFVARRVQQDLQTQSAVLQCRTPAELMAVQSEFVQTAIGAYQAEAERMTALMERATRTAVAQKAEAA